MTFFCKPQTEAIEKQRFQVSKLFCFSLSSIDLLTVLLQVAPAFSSDALTPNGIASLKAKKAHRKVYVPLYGTVILVIIVCKHHFC